MAVIKVNTAGIDHAASSFSYTKKEIETVAESIQKVLNGFDMGVMTGGNDISKSIVRSEAAVLALAVKTDNIVKAIQLIAREYTAVENRIKKQDGTSKAELKYAEMSAAAAELFARTLKFLGFDQLYYNYRTGYTSFNGPAQQEKIMDHYLKDACARLLNRDEYSRETWNNATEAERREILRNFIRDLNRMMGTDVSENVTFTDLGSSTRGSYDPDTNSVTINSTYLGRSDSYGIMQTMIHEMRHCYQHTAVSDPDNFLVSEQTLGQWEYNFNHYRSANIYGYTSYVQQPIEWDAKNFAGQDQDIRGYTPEYRGSW